MRGFKMYLFLFKMIIIIIVVVVFIIKMIFFSLTDFTNRRLAK